MSASGTDKELAYEFMNATTYMIDGIGEYMWTNRDGRLRIYAMISDMFHWASSDAEEITLENMHIFKKAVKDVRDAVVAESDYDGEESCAEYAGLLFAARIRGKKPMKAAMENPNIVDPAIKHLFEEIGPDRTGDWYLTENGIVNVD